LEWHEQGRTLVVRIGDRIGQALVAGQGFSQGEGVMAITRGSSGWRDGEGVERRFAEIFLRGGSAARAFGGVRPGDAVHAVDLADLQAASAVLRAGDRAAIHDLGLAHMTEPQLIDLFVQAGLIRDGFNPTRLRRALTSDCLIDYLQRFERLKSRDDLELRA